MKLLRYVLARYSMIGLTIAPLASLITYLYQHRDQSLAQILAGTQLLLLAFLAVTGVAALRYSKALLDSIDRRFLREKHGPVRRQNEKRVQAPPGLHLRALAEFFFSPKVYGEILEPNLRDLFDEYCAALSLRQGHHWKARWVRVRGYWAFCSAVVAQMPISAFKLIYKIWKAIP